MPSEEQIQEALRNVRRHSDATQADVVVAFNESAIKVTVSDNGKGFDFSGPVDDLTREGKLGLAGMLERSQLLGGNMKVESKPGKGTTVTVEIPAITY